MGSRSRRPCRSKWWPVAVYTLFLSGCGANQTMMATLPVPLSTAGTSTVSSGNNSTSSSSTPVSTSGTPSWSTSKALESGLFATMKAANASSPLLVADNRGQVTALWLQSFDSTGVPGVWAAEKNSSQQWSPAVQIDTYSRAGFAASALLAVADSSGTVTVCWLQAPAVSSATDLWCAQQNAGSASVGTPQLVAQSQPNSAGISSPALTVNPITGTLALTWISGLNTGASALEVSTKVAGNSTWSAAQALSGSTSYSPQTPVVAVSRAADLVTVAWIQGDSQGDPVVYAQQQLGQGGWGAAVPVDGSLPSGSTGDSSLQLAADAQGDVVALWSQGINEQGQVIPVLESASLKAAVWSKPVEVDSLRGTSGYSVGSSSATLSTLMDGSVAAVWRQDFASTPSLLANSISEFWSATWTAGTYNGSQIIALPASWVITGTVSAPAGGPWLLGDTQGNQSLTWIQLSQALGIGEVESLYGKGGLGVTAITPIPVMGPPMNPGPLALSAVLDSSGGVNVAWVQTSGPNNQIYAAVETP